MHEPMRVQRPGWHQVSCLLSPRDSLETGALPGSSC